VKNGFDITKVELVTDNHTIQNFFREAKYLILLGENGETKVVVLK